MTRQEVEKELMRLLEKAEKIANEYNPNGGRLLMTAKDGIAWLDNEARGDGELHVLRNKDGEIWSFGFGEIK